MKKKYGNRQEILFRSRDNLINIVLVQSSSFSKRNKIIYTRI